MNFGIELDLAGWLLFVFAGIFTGIINTLAGSGSLITLPIFLYICGLPPGVANGTNRVGVLIQSLVGSWGFWCSGKLPTNRLLLPMLIAIAGAYLGSTIATRLDERIMNYSIGALMVLMLAILLVSPERWLRSGTPGGQRNHHPGMLIAFFFIGMYGGFIQAGVGLFLLAALVLLGGYDLVSANAIKLLAVLWFNIPAFIVFMRSGQVHLGYGLLMAVFQSVGAWLGVRFASRIPGANRWIHRLLVVIVIVSAVKVLGLWDYLRAVVL
ncbi:MAG: sulfite exporter TauE/SafE family protein [Bacteroidia bacterium]